MRPWIAFVSVLALTACSQSEPSTGPEPVEVTPPAPAVEAGVYDFTNVEGANNRAELGEDGSYTTYGEDGAVSGAGTWTNNGRRTCFDPEGDTPEVCYSASAPADDGSFTGTSDDGGTITVRPVPGATGEDAEI